MRKSILLAASICAIFIGSFVFYKHHYRALPPKPGAIPVEVLFGVQEQKTTARISPDGTMLAYKAPVNNIMNLWVRTIGKEDDRPITKDTERGNQSYLWAFDNQHLLYVQNKDGDENWQLYKVRLSDGQVTNLTPIKDVQVRLLEYRKQHPDRLLLEINQRDPKNHDVYELNLKDNSLKVVAENMGDVAGWAADWQLNVRAAVQMRPDGGSQLLVRDNEKSSWRTIGVWSADEEIPHPYDFSFDGKKLYIADSRNADTTQLVTLDVATGKATIIARDEQYDMGSSEEFKPVFNQDDGKIQAVYYMRERVKWLALDPALTTDLEAMQELDHGDMYLANRTADGKIWALAFVKDNGPIAFWLYNLETKQRTFLFDHNPLLRKYKLASTQPIQFTSRDGLTIHGYLTCPTHVACTKVPLVLLVHGGPWLRDDWGFNPQVQFLASRGYAVLQVNYRSSKGYGKKFLTAGFKEWGGKMHDDLVDAVQWAIKEGIADPKKIAIFGGSYGGYAALVGATFTPDLFCCAVDIVGISNLTSFINSFPPYWEIFKALVIKRIGDPAKEEQFLQSRSPLFKVDAIKIPLLIAQGANDPRVKQAESEQIVAKLREKGVPHDYMLFPDEGHGFVKPENKIKFYKKAEEFLAKYLG